MKINVNGKQRETDRTTLDALLLQLGYTQHAVATAVNGKFVANHQRENILLTEGMTIEIVAPVQGG